MQACGFLISIHALRVEGDTNTKYNIIRKKISIHALRVEGDRQDPQLFPEVRYFYPRPPGGGRPAERSRATRAVDHISIHALRVEGDLLPRTFRQMHVPISIHALRVEGDLLPRTFRQMHVPISIHALRVEGD